MANTFTSLHYHVIFSTKNREPWIRADIEARVWSYLGGIARENDMKALMVGGIEKHEIQYDDRYLFDGEIVG